MRRASVILALAVASAAAAEAQKGQVLLDDCDYATTQAARAVWRPIDPASPGVEVVTAADRRMLKLPCNFATNEQWRVGWDRSGQWDLSACSEIFLSVAAGHPDVHRGGARMSLYLRSGGGWYGRSFEVPPGSSTVRLARKSFNVQGKPAGWERIDGVRLCVLRDEGADRAVLVAGLGAIEKKAHVAVYRNDAGVKDEGGVGRYAQLAVDALDRLGIACDLVDDKAVAAGRLAGKQVAVLPLNPVLPAAAAAAVRNFVAGGGKLLVCYRLPEPLGELLDIRLAGRLDGKDGQLAGIVFQGREDRPKVQAAQHSWIAHRIVPGRGAKVVGHWVDRAGKVTDLPAVTRNENGYFVGHVFTEHAPSAKDRLLLEMLGQLWPAAWEEVARHRLEALGRAAGLGGVKELSAAAEANAANDPPRRKKVADLLGRADRAARDAEATMKYGDAVVAAELLAQAQDDYARAYAVSVPSRAGEFRAVWCHSPAGLADRSWEQAMKTLAEAGFNAIIPNMCWGDGAAYKSKVLPVLPVVGERGDQLAECLAAAKKHGVAVHVWKVNWHFWWAGAKEFRERMRQAGRVQLDPRGKPLDWLCPSHPENQKLELEAMLEIVRNYDVDGLHFDYIRYPGLDACYCTGCRQRFEAARGAKVGSWPDDVRTGKLKQAYLQFRRDNITALVAAVAEQARKIKPGVLISAAVFWHWPSARDGVGQDWKLWLEKGYLDFVCPMQYTPDHASFEHRTRQTVAWAGRVPLMTGIGATLGLSPDGTLRQVLLARQHQAAGFVLFNYTATLADEHLPLLHLGASAEKTTWRLPRRGTMPAGR